MGDDVLYSYAGVDSIAGGGLDVAHTYRDKATSNPSFTAVTGTVTLVGNGTTVSGVETFGRTPLTGDSDTLAMYAVA